jgi:hemerythrin
MFISINYNYNNMDNDDYEIGNIETFGSGNDSKFSHQFLVMKCLCRCIDCGSVEMIEGRMETKKDKMGNVETKYTPDTRRQFIEAVNTAKNFLVPEFDEQAKKEIKKYMEDIKYNKNYWLKKEMEYWNTIGYQGQQAMIKNGQQVIKGMHNQRLIFKDNSLYDELDIWRDVLESLNKLTKRLKYYEGQNFST